MKAKHERSGGPIVPVSSSLAGNLVSNLLSIHTIVYLLGFVVRFALDPESHL